MEKNNIVNNKENENKKTLINKKIEAWDLYKYAEIIELKALRIIEASGNKKATEIIENKKYYKADDWDDIKQIIVENIIENNYTITKQTYYIVNKYINDNIKDNSTKIKTKKIVEKIDEKTGELKKEWADCYIDIPHTSIEKTLDDDDKSSILNYISYLSYNSSKIIINNTKKQNAKNIIEALKLTEKQRELLNIYSKTQSFEKTASFLGISKQAINITIKRIKEKLAKLDIQVA